MDVQLGQVYRNPRTGLALRVVPNPFFLDNPRQHRFHVELSADGLDQWRVVGRTANLEGAAKQIEQYLG